MDWKDLESIAASMNQNSAGFAQAMGFKFISAGPDEVVLEWTVADQHLQPFGIVHGGVHCGAVETVCSIGAALAAAERGYEGGVVGLENHTSFLRATRTGAKLRARATPVTRGSTTQVWKCEIRDDAGALIANGSVRLLCTPKLGRKVGS
jgi:1,4-dihydroxy-2-naphthoyl-CoA hydrolase